MMMENNIYPKISIITPSFNQGQFLEQTILSVLDQNYPNLEYIIIDGGSCDESVEIIKKYEEKLAFWISEKDSGQSEAINKGFRKATGEIIAWINSDDFYCENAFHKVAEHFIKNPNSFWVAGKTIFVDKNGYFLSRKKPVYSKFILRYGTSSIYQPSIFLRSCILKDIGYLNEEFHAIMDQEWYVRISEHYTCNFIDSDIANFRWHENSKSSSKKKSLHHNKYVYERKIIFKNYHKQTIKLFNKNPYLVMLLFENISRLFKIYFRIERTFQKKIFHLYSLKLLF